jgi:large-conductance mechanosensitive channel
MKNSLVNYILAFFCTILIIEGIQWGFYLMTLSDTLFFYLGSTIVAVILFLVGWFIVKELNKLFSKKDKTEE